MKHPRGCPAQVSSLWLASQRRRVRGRFRQPSTEDLRRLKPLRKTATRGRSRRDGDAVIAVTFYVGDLQRSKLSLGDGTGAALTAASISTPPIRTTAGRRTASVPDVSHSDWKKTGSRDDVVNLASTQRTTVVTQHTPPSTATRSPCGSTGRSCSAQPNRPAQPGGVTRALIPHVALQAHDRRSVVRFKNIRSNGSTEKRPRGAETSAGKT
jgi:hypothetical protein